MAARTGHAPDIGEEYIIQRFWRSSGEAVLYIGHHVTGGKHVIKLLRSVERDDRKAYLEWLNRLRCLDHPRILKVKDIGLAKDPEGAPFIVTEYFIWKNTLRDLILHMGPLHPRLAEQVVMAILEGLSYAHGREPAVLHRDLKPENVLVITTPTRLLDLKLIDFSMASTASYQISGTPPYQSPEQTFRDGIVTPASDVFSVGTIFYELLTGRPAFHGPNSAAMQDRIRADDIDFDYERIDSYQARFLRRCLAKEPLERFSSASEALAYLQTKPPVMPATKHIPKLAASILVAMMGVVLLALLVVAFSGKDAEKRQDEVRVEASEVVEQPDGEGELGDGD